MWKSYNNRRITFVIGLGLSCLSPLGLLRADIIDDVNQLEQKKDKTVPANPANTDSNSGLSDTTKSEVSESKATTKAVPDAKKPNGKKNPGRARSDAPIHLQSDGTSTYSRNGAVAHLQKNVLITQDDIRLQSDEATIHLNPGSKNNSNIQSVELIGKVNVSRFAKDPTERVTARSDKAVFDNNSQVVTLDGDARLWRDGHMIKGDRIVYDIVSGLIKVDRAQGVVQPEKSGK